MKAKVKCIWNDARKTGHTNHWIINCGQGINTFYNEAGPDEPDFIFCPYCGKEIEEWP